MKLTLTALIALVAYAGPSTQGPSVLLAPLFENPEAEVVPDEYIVLLKDGDVHSADFVSSLESAVEGIDLIHVYNQGFAAKLTPDALMAIRQRVEVEFVEPNSMVYAHGVQNNVPSWGLARIGQRKFNSRSVYTYPDSAGEGVDVYVIDTGVFIDHKDFEGRAKWGFTAINGEDDTDGNGHGTHVASTIAGKDYGVAKKANIIAVRVLNSYGSGTMADVVKGIEWTTDASKKSGKKSLANMSLGGGRSMALDRAVELSIAAGVQYAVAAGNSNADSCRFSPAAVKEAVTVGASNVNDNRAYFSNHGSCNDIFGPGEGITGAWIGDSSAKKTISGTSMAAPHVAGVMALFLGEKGAEYSPASLKEKILASGTPDILTSVPRGTKNILLFNRPSSDDYELFF